MGMKLAPEFEAKRDEWLGAFDDALAKFVSAQGRCIEAGLRLLVRNVAKDQGFRLPKKKERKAEVGFFGMTLGSTRERAISGLAELGFAPEGDNKRELCASKEGEPVRFDLVFERSKLVRVTFRFAYPPRTHVLKTRDFEHAVYKRIGGGKAFVHTRQGRDRGILGLWDAPTPTSGAYAALWRERDEEAKVHTICFSIWSVNADSPKVISDFFDELERFAEIEMAKEFGDDDFDDDLE